MAKQLSNILTESGTNEVEVLVFEIDGGHYGVNVAKVRDIIMPLPMTRLDESHAAVRGAFKLRDRVISLVDLRKFFDMTPLADETDTRIIVMEFNNDQIGFLVDKVEQIHRVSWKEMSEPPWIGSHHDPSITSVLRQGDDLILMIDFERIVFQIAGITSFEAAEASERGVNRAAVRILLADDSATMRRMLGDSLRAAGFKNVTCCTDGENAWNALVEMSDSACLPDIIVTDIEMPRIDGLHLTRKIKSHPSLKDIPVIVFSSLVSDDNLKKCEAVGADRQLTKPDLPTLAKTIDELLTAEPSPV